MNPYTPLFEAAAKQYGEDPYWLQAMAEQESSYNPTATSPKGAVGLMQLMPATAKELGVVDPYDPEQNIQGGSWYYVNNKKKYNDPNLALMAYNWGPSNVENWIKAGARPEAIPQETRDYVQKVHSRYKKLKSSQQEPQKMAPTEDPLEAALMANYEDAQAQTQGDGDPLEAALMANYDDPEPRQEAGPEWLQTIGRGGEKIANAAYDVTQAIGRDMTPWKMATIVPSMAVAPAMGVVANATKAVPLIGTAAQYAAGAVPEGAGLLTKAGHRLVSGAFQGGVANKLMGGDFTEGAETGALLNTAVLPLVAGTVKGARNIFGTITGNRPQMSPEVAQLAQTASEKYGINIPGGLLNENPMVRRTYSMLDRFGMTPADESATNLVRGVGKTIGVDSNKLTREVMQQAKDNIGQMYDDVAAITPSVKLDNKLLDTMSKLEQANNELLIPVNDNRLKMQLDKVLTSAAENNGEIPISVWKDFTKSKGTLSKLIKEGGTVGELAGEFRSALREALRNNAPPTAIAKLDEADRLYKNFKTIEKVAEKNPVTGELNPLSIANQVNVTSRKFGRGGVDELQELGDIGRQFQLDPSSGTTENYLMAKLGGVLGQDALSALRSLTGQTMVGAGAYSLGGVPAVLGSYAAGKAAGSYLGSQGYRNRLIESALNPPQESMLMRLLQGASPSISNVLVSGNQALKP